MIRTIVVDDEPYLRKSIKTSIESTNPEFEVIAEAGNGVQALKLIAELHPDVVFLDIRMPVMDGIALLDKLFHKGVQPIRVILSGYSEFEYAKKAIQYGVFDYVLKPIHPEQLSELLSNIAVRISQKNINKEYEYLNYIFKGIQPSAPEEELTRAMQAYKKYYCFYLIAGSYMYTKNNQFSPAGDFWNADTLLADIEKLCTAQERLWCISGENQNEVLLIVGTKLSELPSTKLMASRIYNLCSDLPVPVTMVFSPAGISLGMIRDEAINLKYTSIWNVRFGHSSLIEWSENQSSAQNDSFLSDDNIDTLKTCVQEKRYQDFRHFVRRFVDSFCERRIFQHQLRIELIRILEILRGDYLSREIQDLVDENITNALTYEDITNVLLQYIDDYTKNYYRDISQDLSGMIKDHIDEHYEMQLTLKEIAAHFHISPSYLSTVFKKTFSVSPNEYIMNKRIAKAKDLLGVFPPINVNQIAGMIGYTDPFYFSRIFKMTTGLTPSEYRISINKES